MGIKDLWPLVDEAAFTCKLRDFIVEHGFLKEHYGLRTVVIGIDVSSFLDGFRAADRAQGQLHSSNATLTQFFKLLCGLSKAGAHCIFVYDGDKRPKIKRGRQVVTNELDYLKQSRTMVEHFGYHSHMAPGEAEAEIVDMLKQGIVDIVLSKDSDVFPLGAASVMNLVVPRDKSKARKSWLDLEVRIYHTESMEFSQGGFILIALLLHNDFGNGGYGIGLSTARGLAQSGFGETLLRVYESLSPMPQRLLEALQELNHDMAYEIQHNKRGKMGSCSPARAEILQNSNFPTFDDLEALSTFLKPVTSSSEGLPPLLASLRLPTLPNISGIVAFSTEHFAWSPKLTLQHFHNYLWPGVIIRMLSSKYIAYNADNSEVLVPRLQNKFETDSKGHLYIPTFSTTVMNKDALDFQEKDASDTISVVFNTSFFIQLTGLNSTSAQSRRVDVPVSMIAVAINNLNKVVNLHQMIGPRSPPSQTSIEAEASSSHSLRKFPLKRKQSDNLIAGSSFKSFKRVKDLGVIELTDSDNDSLY
ncbi:MAG: PIN domain-like protein [Lentinula lateritia]|nr:MAG: PIN domain-like protein [Lentinula lateritia]